MQDEELAQGRPTAETGYFDAIASVFVAGAEVILMERVCQHDVPWQWKFCRNFVRRRQFFYRECRFPGEGNGETWPGRPSQECEWRQERAERRVVHARFFAEDARRVLL